MGGMKKGGEGGKGCPQRAGLDPPMPRNYGEKNVMCPLVSVFLISVQLSFNVD